MGAIRKERIHAWLLDVFRAAREEQTGYVNPHTCTDSLPCHRNSLFLCKDHNIVLMSRKLSEKEARRVAMLRQFKNVSFQSLRMKKQYFSLRCCDLQNRILEVFKVLVFFCFVFLITVSY